MRLGNLYAGIPPALPAELFEDLLKTDRFRLARIVSKGHTTAAGEWYDQADDEWVVLLRGAACLRIEGEDRTITLAPGDYLHIPAHVRHRVEWTAADGETIWLALHF